VTVEHRDVVSTEDEVTVLETRVVITNTPVKYIILFGVGSADVEATHYYGPATQKTGTCGNATELY
jgi:hypothetical protein